MSNLFEQLKRRNVFRAVAAYLALSWMLLQVVDLISPIVGLPDSTMRIMAAILLLGFIPTLIVSWVYEITPDGLQKDEQVAEDNNAYRHMVASRMNAAVIVMVVIAIALLALDRFFVPEQAAAPQTVQLDTAGEDDGKIDSIAVLPFADFSAAGDKGYLGDGIADTVLHMLAGVDGLRVAARTSSFRFRDDDVDIATIGRQLGVESVLEGSVQTSGDQLRIIAQLVRTSDQTHIWSRTFDRKATDIFAIQDEIANAVVAEVSKSPGGAVDVLKSSRTSPEVYAMVLQARQLTRNRSAPDIQQALDLLGRAVEIDTTYAPAHSEMAAALYFSTMYGTGDLEALRPRIEAEIDTALQLDPKDSNAYAIRGAMWNQMEQLDRVRSDFERALELNPSDVETMTWLGELLRDQGDIESARQWYRRAYETDPLNAKVRHDYSLFLIEVERDIDAAIAVGEESVALGLNPKFAQMTLATLYMRVSRLADVGRAYFAAAKIDPNSPDVYGAMAFWMAFMEDRELAERWRAAAIEARPQMAHSPNFFFRRFFGEEEQLLNEVEARLAEDPDSPAALAKVCSVAAQMGRFERALEVGERFDALSPDPAQLNPTMMVFQAYSMAIIHRRAGRQEKSRFYVNKMQRLVQDTMQQSANEGNQAEFLMFFVALAKGEFETVADRLESLEVGGPIVYLNMRYNALTSDSRANQRVQAWLDDYAALIESERAEMRTIEDEAFWSPSLLRVGALGNSD